LSQVETPVHFIRHGIEPGEAVFLGVISIGRIKAERQEGVVVLPRFMERHLVLIEIGPGLDITRVAPEHILDEPPVFGRKNGIIVDEAPGPKDIPQGKVNVRPRLSDPLSGLLRALAEDRHSVKKKPRPLRVAGEKIHQGPLGRGPVGRAFSDILFHRPEGRFGALRRIGNFMLRLEKAEDADAL
jgi:hypothetical protein